MTDYGERARRLHPDLAYQGDLAGEQLTDERRAVAERVSGRRRILEVGCASGWFGAHLRSAGHEVLGVEGDPRAAERARALGLGVVEGDIEDAATWAAVLERGGPFDAILSMHVLEHLADPWEALRRMRPLLAPGGTVVSLLPNVAAWRVRKALFLHGRFDYADTGILDRTHLRFFTLATAVDLHRAAGFGEVLIEPVQWRVPFEPWLRHRFRLPKVADRWETAMVARWPNVCTEVALVVAGE